jgi:hypothetical protein
MTMDYTAQLTDFIPAYNAVRHPCERRRFAVRFAAGTFGLIGLLASVFTGHSPEPSRCDPGPAQTIITRPVSPDNITLDRCPPGGVKYTIR